MGERVIVVDNNQTSAEMLSSCLRKFGSETVVCENGEECLAEIARGDVSMIFMEVTLPDISAIDLLTAIRQGHNLIELPVIMVSALKDDETMAKAISYGANEFLHKPIDCMVTIARIYQQLLALDLYKKSLIKKRSETINSMIATYNHQINNTLSVAFAELHLAQRDNAPTTLERVSDALRGISVVVKKIKELSGDDVEETEYLLGGKMVKLREDAIA